MIIYGEVKQRQHFYHHGDTICHPKSGYVTTKLHGTKHWPFMPNFKDGSTVQFFIFRDKTAKNVPRREKQVKGQRCMLPMWGERPL